MKMRVRAALFASAILVVMLAAVPAYAANKDAFEPDNKPGTAKTIALTTDVIDTTLQMHTFHSNSDVDYVKFQGKKNAHYAIKVLGTDTTNKKRWLAVSVWQHNTKRKVWYLVYPEVPTTGAYNWHLPFKASATTDYLVEIRPYGKHGSGTDYGLRVISGTYPAVTADSYEPTDSVMASATALSVLSSWDATSFDNEDGIYKYGLFGACQLHSIWGASDGDWYSVTMPPGHEYYIMFAVGDRTNRTMNIDFYRPGGTPLFQNSGLINSHAISFTPAVNYTQMYYFHVTGNGKEKFWYRVGLFSAP